MAGIPRQRGPVPPRVAFPFQASAQVVAELTTVEPAHRQLREARDAMAAAVPSGSALAVIEAADRVFTGYGLGPVLERAS